MKGLELGHRISTKFYNGTKTAIHGIVRGKATSQIGRCGLRADAASVPLVVHLSCATIAAVQDSGPSDKCAQRKCRSTRQSITN